MQHDGGSISEMKGQLLPAATKMITIPIKYGHSTSPYKRIVIHFSISTISGGVP